MYLSLKTTKQKYMIEPLIEKQWHFESVVFYLPPVVSSPDFDLLAEIKINIIRFEVIAQ